MTPLSIYVNGTALSHLGHYGSVVVTHRFPYGSFELRWSANYPRGFARRELVTNAEVVAQVGPCRVFRGDLVEPDWDSGEFVAQGSIRRAETTLAYNLSGPTTDIDEALFFGAARGAVNVGTLLNFGAPLTTGETDQSNSLLQLLDVYAAQNATNMMADPHGLLYSVGDPTTPWLRLVPGVGELGVADQDYWTTVIGSYLPAPGKKGRVTAGPDTSQNVGARERAVDLSGLGFISAAKAQAVVDRILSKGAARTGWTNSLLVGDGQIENMSGKSLEPWLVARRMAYQGVMARLAGLRDPRGVTLFTDVILEETVWDVDADTIELKPRGLAARDFSAIVESMGAAVIA